MGLPSLAPDASFSHVTQTYGLQLHRDLGTDAPGVLAQTWGAGYGLQCVAEWRSVVGTALALLVAHPLRAGAAPRRWLEAQADMACCQAALFGSAVRGSWAQTRVLAQLQSRLRDV